MMASTTKKQVLTSLFYWGGWALFFSGVVELADNFWYGISLIFISVISFDAAGYTANQ